MAPRIRFRPQYRPTHTAMRYGGGNIALGAKFSSKADEVPRVTIGVEAGAPKYVPGQCYICLPANQSATRRVFKLLHAGAPPVVNSVGMARIGDGGGLVYTWRRICRECLLSLRRDGRIKAVDTNAQMVLILEP
jgi:hypothetical protein